MKKIILSFVFVCSSLVAGPSAVSKIATDVIDSGGKAATDVINASSSKTVIQNSTIKADTKTKDVTTGKNSVLSVGGVNVGKGSKIQNSKIISKTKTGKIKTGDGSVAKIGGVNIQ